MTLGNGSNLCDFSCDDTIIKNSLSEKILGLTIENLDFSDRISNRCKTANQKLKALFRVSANMNSDKCTLLINSLIESHFSYCPLIWMFCNQKSMKKVNKIQECYLQLMTNNVEAYKCLNGISSGIMNDTLAVSKHQYNTWHYNLFVTD